MKMKGVLSIDEDKIKELVLISDQVLEIFSIVFYLVNLICRN